MELERTIRLVGLAAVGNTRAAGISNYIYHLQKYATGSDLVWNFQDANIRYLCKVEPFRKGELLHIPLIMGSQVLLTGRYPRSVVTVHDLGGLLSPFDRAYNSGESFRNFLFKLALRGLRRAEHIIAISEFTRTALIENLGIEPDKVSAIYFGVDHQNFQPRPKRDARQILEEKLGLKFAEGQPVLLYVGSELPRKNLVTLWQGLRILRLIYPGALVLKVGSPAGKPGLRQTTLEQIAEAGQSGAVKFLDKVADDLLPLLYSAADVFVQPSLYEGFSLPSAEAMAAGCPVAAARATCLPEIIGEGGLYFQPAEAVELAAAVERLFEDGVLRKKTVEKGLAQAGKYQWPEMARKTFEVYQNLK